MPAACASGNILSHTDRFQPWQHSVAHRPRNARTRLCPQHTRLAVFNHGNILSHTDPATPAPGYARSIRVWPFSTMATFCRTQTPQRPHQAMPAACASGRFQPWQHSVAHRPRNARTRLCPQHARLAVFNHGNMRSHTDPARHNAPQRTHQFMPVFFARIQRCTLRANDNDNEMAIVCRATRQVDAQNLSVWLSFSDAEVAGNGKNSAEQ